MPNHLPIREVRQRNRIVIRCKILKIVLQLRDGIALWIPLYTPRGMLVPRAKHSVQLHALDDAPPLVGDDGALEQRVDDVAVDPVGLGEALLLHVVREVVAAFGPVGAEVAAEAAAPARTSHALFARGEHVRLLVVFCGAAARGAAVRLPVVCGKVFLEEVDCGTEVAFEHFWALLVRFFVALPVCLFDKGFFAAGAEVLVRFGAGSGLLVGRDAGFEVVLFLHDGLPGRSPLGCDGTGFFYGAGEVRGRG